MEIHQRSDSSIDRYRNSIMARKMQRQKQLEELETQLVARQSNQERSSRNSVFNTTLDKTSKRNSLSYTGHRSSVQEFTISLKDLSVAEPRRRGADMFNASKDNSPSYRERKTHKSLGKDSPNDIIKRRRHSGTKVLQPMERSRSGSLNFESSRLHNYFEEAPRNLDCSRISDPSKYQLEKENRDLQTSLQNEMIASEKQRLRIEVLKQMLTSSMKDLKDAQGQDFNSRTVDNSETLAEYGCLKKKHHQLLIDYESLKDTLIREEERSSSLLQENLRLKKDFAHFKQSKDSLTQELMATKAVKDDLVRNEEDKKSLMAFLNEKMEEISASKKESVGLQRRLEEVEKENQLLIEKCLRFTAGTEGKEEEVVKLKRKYQDLSKEHAELQLAHVELENTKAQQGRAMVGLEKKNAEICDENAKLEELLTQLRDEVNRLDNERRMLEKGFINEIEKRDERYTTLRRRVEYKSNESEFTAKESLIQELEGKTKIQKKIIEELNESIRQLTNNMITLEGKLKAPTSQEEQLRAKVTELSRANEDIARRKEDMEKMQDEIIRLKEQALKLQEKLGSLQYQLYEKDSSLKEKDFSLKQKESSLKEKDSILKEKESCIVSLREQLQTSKEKIKEQDNLILKLQADKAESEGLQAKIKNLEKQCSDQRRELDTANVETKELRSTLIAALENANKTESLRKVELEHAQHSMIALEKQIDKNSPTKELLNVILMIKSALTAVLENSQAYKAIYCSVSEPFRQLVNQQLLSSDKLQEIPSSEQSGFLKNVFGTIFTEIKLLSQKVIESENKIIRLNAQSLEAEEKLASKNQAQAAQLELMKQSIKKESRNPSLSIADSFEKENIMLEMKYDRKGSNYGDSSMSDLVSDGHGEQMMSDVSTLMKTPPERSCLSVLDNNTIVDLQNSQNSQNSSQSTDKGKIGGPKKVGKINLKNLKLKQKDDSLDNIHELELKDNQDKAKVNCSPAPKITFRQEEPKAEVKKL